MSINFGNAAFWGNVSLNSDKKPLNANVARAKADLSALLFKGISTSLISFGWSQGLPEAQTKILDTLTSPAVKNVLVISHTNPDGDAYGTVMGVGGILKSLGKNVSSVIDDEMKSRFMNYPTYVSGREAAEVITHKSNFNNLRGKKFDLVVITDTAEPTLTSDRVLNLLGNAKKVVLIDHHPDTPREARNVEKWTDAIIGANRGIKPENILYWREPREAAAELIAEMDREVVEASKKGEIKDYNPQRNNVDLKYRLSTAAGILTDADGEMTDKGMVDKTTFVRASDKTINTPQGKASPTRVDFEWLVNNSGVAKKDINMRDIALSNNSGGYHESDDYKNLVNKIDNIISGDESIEGIKVTRATKAFPVTVVELNNTGRLDKIAEKHGLRGDVKGVLNWRLKENMINDPNTAGFALVRPHQPSNSFSINFQSYGSCYANGDSYKPGHIVAESLAKGVLNEFFNQGIVKDGFGHNNYSIIKIVGNKDFNKDGLPVIKKAVAKLLNSKEQEPVRSAKTLRMVAFGDRGSKLNVVA